MKIRPSTKTTNPKAGLPVNFGFTFPEGFILVLDTREAEEDPLFLHRPHKGLTIVRDTLQTGDYSIRGFEAQIAVERKKPYDLLNCLGKDRERFKREMERLRGYEWKTVVVESTEAELLYQHHEFSMMVPESVRQSIVSIEIRYNISFYFQPNREHLERWILDRFLKFYRVKKWG